MTAFVLNMFFSNTKTSAVWPFFFNRFCSLPERCDRLLLNMFCSNTKTSAVWPLFFEHDFSWNKTIAVCHAFLYVHVLFVNLCTYLIYTVSILLSVFCFFSSPYLYPIYTPCPFSGIFLLPIYTLSILQVRFLVFFCTLSIPYLYSRLVFWYFSSPYLYSRLVFWYFSSPYLYPIYTLSISYIYIYIYTFYIALKSLSSRICSSNVWPYIYYNSFSFFKTAHFIKIS